MSTKSIGAYVRVSSAGQDLAAQEPDLRAWLERNGDSRRVIWYRDTSTGRTMNRPGMQALERDIRGGRVGTVVLWRLDRLGRTAKEMIAFFDELDTAGVECVSVRDSIDTRTATGRLMRTILAGFAEYEREVIFERVRSGIAKARAAGKRWGGRKAGVRPTLTDERLASIAVLQRAGASKSADAPRVPWKSFGVAPAERVYSD